MGLSGRLLRGGSLLSSPLLSGAGAGGNDSFTKLLLHMDGTDASTTFTDSSASAHAVTAGNGAQIDTAQQKFGTGSGLFVAANNDHLSLDGHADFTYGTGDFTIDFWFRPATIGATAVFYEGRPSATNGVYPVVYLDASNVVVFFVSSTNQIVGTTTVSADTWYHCALARSGTETKLFLDGVQEGSTYSDSNDYLSGGAGRPLIGIDTPAGTLEFDGWIDELRVSKGIARWTANFSPPGGPYS